MREDRQHREYLTPAEAAELLGIRERTVKEFIRVGKLTGVLMPGVRGYMLRRADVLEEFAELFDLAVEEARERKAERVERERARDSRMDALMARARRKGAA